MRVESTPEARAVLEKVRALRSGTFVLSLGTGCCDSTAPFLFENHLVEPGSRRVGTVADVAVMAPAWLDDAYRGETLVLDVREDPSGESFSAESELGFRFVLVSAEGRESAASPEGRPPGVTPPGRDASTPARISPVPSPREAGHAPRTPRLRPLVVPERFRHLRLRP